MIYLIDLSDVSPRGNQERGATVGRTHDMPDITMSHTPGAVFLARLLHNQEDANTERCVFGKFSARWFQRPDLVATGTLPTVEVSTIENRPLEV